MCGRGQLTSHFSVLCLRGGPRRSSTSRRWRCGWCSNQSCSLPFSRCIFFPFTRRGRRFVCLHWPWHFGTNKLKNLQELQLHYKVAGSTLAPSISKNVGNRRVADRSNTNSPRDDVTWLNIGSLSWAADSVLRVSTSWLERTEANTPATSRQGSKIIKGVMIRGGGRGTRPPRFL